MTKNRLDAVTYSKLMGSDHYPGADEYAVLRANALPPTSPFNVDGLSASYDSRRDCLVARIKDKLQTQRDVDSVAALPIDIDAELGAGDLED